MENQRITESELILPSLFLLSLKPHGCIRTSELIPLLTDLMKPYQVVKTVELYHGMMLLKKLK